MDYLCGPSPWTPSWTGHSVSYADVSLSGRVAYTPPPPDFPSLDGRWKPFFLYGLSIKWPAYNCYVQETCKTSFRPHCLKYAGHFVLAPHKENLISLLTGCKGKGFKNEVWGAEGNVKSGMNSFMNTETYQANTTVQQTAMSHSSVKLLNEFPLVD